MDADIGAKIPETKSQQTQARKFESPQEIAALAQHDLAWSLRLRAFASTTTQWPQAGSRGPLRLTAALTLHVLDQPDCQHRIV